MRRHSIAVLLVVTIVARFGGAQEPPTEKVPTAAKTPELASQIELLETHVRFEVNGDSRKEVHAQVHINNELGVPQFAHLNFDYNRAFQQIEIPLVRITHASGGTAEILPSAIADQPSPAVVNAPAYQDVRVKSVRILGLTPGDNLEYRVITITTHHPLAPDFWFDHTFDRSGVVSHEMFELDLPASLDQSAQSVATSSPQALISTWYKPKVAQMYVSPQVAAPDRVMEGERESARVRYRWQISGDTVSSPPPDSDQRVDSDLVVTTFSSWTELARQIAKRLTASGGLEVIEPTERQLVYGPSHGTNPQSSIYEFVAKKIRTVDLPLGSMGFHTRRPEEVLASGYGTPEDKFALFSALLRFTYKPFHPLLICSMPSPQSRLPSPTAFSKLIVETVVQGDRQFLDLSLEVAPFGAIPANLRGKPALAVYEGYQGMNGNLDWWTQIPMELPFPSVQRVNVNATLARDGALNARVKYTLRGDAELLLRVAFHQASREKWNDVAQLLALSDGFRGKVTKASAADPYDTKNPFTLEYEITQPKFVDWSKTPVRIPALLPLVGLPNPASKAAEGTAASAVELGTPLEVDTRVTLNLPADTSAEVPTGTAVTRDYAKFASKYSVNGPMVTAVRHLSFLLREVPASRRADYNAFVRAVQTDEAQEFTLNRAAPLQSKLKRRRHSEKTFSGQPELKTLTSNAAPQVPET